jgi:hypothetical protein
METFIVLTITGVAAFYTVRRILKSVRTDPSAGCGCCGCETATGCGGCGSRDNDPSE